MLFRSIVALLIVPLLPVMGTSTAVVPHSAIPAATTAAAIADGASFRVENGVVKFYFASNEVVLATGAESALADVSKAVAAGKRAVVSGFTDPTGDSAKNEELALRRARAVNAALEKAGIPTDKIQLKRPETVTGTGSDAEARRVEVSLV